MAEEIKTRAQLAPEDTWNLADLYPSRESWKAEQEQLKKALPALEAFRGKLSESSAVQELFRLEHDFMLRLERLFVYAKMNRDQDNADEESVAMTDEAMSLMTLAETATAFVVPELNALPAETLLAWAEQPAFADRSRFLKEIVRNKPHVLSEGEERILALSGEVGSAFDTVFTMLEDVDMTFDSVKTLDGEIPMSHGRYGVLLQSRDRDTRQQAYRSMYAAQRRQINTLAALYGASVKKDVFYARARHFDTALEAELFGGEIPVSVYDGLIEAVHAGLPTLHRYIALRKQLLELDDMKMFDLYVPLVSREEAPVSYAEAQQTVLEALAPLGEEYCAVLKAGFAARWVDVYETKGKTSGAYSWGSYGVHPYMLLNFQGRLEDIFTLAHEAGHSMHTYFSDRALPYEKAQYRIFVAEVASTVNEVLLLQHLLKKTSDRRERAYLLNHLLEQFRTTVFRQTMFAEFERAAHTRAEAGESLTPQWLNGIYAELNRTYYSDSVDTDEDIATEWARIPHFYNCYYVYQYATGFSAAVAIADGILNGRKDAVEQYLAFLSSGGSDAPVELLKLAGVDLSRPDAIASGMEVFKNTLKEFEGLVK